MRNIQSRKRQRQESNLQAMFSIAHQFSKLRRYNHFGTLAYISITFLAYSNPCITLFSFINFFDILLSNVTFEFYLMCSRNRMYILNYDRSFLLNFTLTNSVRCRGCLSTRPPPRLTLCKQPFATNIQEYITIRKRTLCRIVEPPLSTNSGPFLVYLAHFLLYERTCPRRTNKST